MTVCPKHKDAYGIRWRTGKTNCCVPTEVAGHKTTSNLGDRGMDSKQSYFIFQETGLLVPAESRWWGLFTSICLFSGGLRSDRDCSQDGCLNLFWETGILSKQLRTNRENVCRCARFPRQIFHASRAKIGESWVTHSVLRTRNIWVVFGHKHSISLQLFRKEINLLK